MTARIEWRQTEKRRDQGRLELEPKRTLRVRATQRSVQEMKEAWWFIGRLTDQKYQRRLEPRKELGHEKRQMVLRRLATI